MAVSAIDNDIIYVSGIKYTHTTDDSSDWDSVSNDTYFYDLDTKLPYYKNGDGDVLYVFQDSSNGGSGTKVLVKGSMGANQTATPSIPIVEFITTGTPAGGSFDVNSEWDNTNHKFTVGASGAGTYLIQSQIFLSNGTGWSTLYLYKNGSIYSPFGN